MKSIWLGRTLYNLGAHPPPEPPPGDALPRPAGTLAWLHAPGPAVLPQMIALARRLREEDGIAVLVTHPNAGRKAGGRPIAAPPVADDLVIHATPPVDQGASVRAFLDHWRPDIAILAAGEVRPALALEARRRRLPLMIVEAHVPHLPAGRAGWYPGLMRSSLEAFGRIMVMDERAVRSFRKAGAPQGIIHVAGRMEQPSTALPCREEDWLALAAMTAARPIWFAAAVPPEEEAAILAAHRVTLGFAHRLLLVVMPEDAAHGEKAALAAEREGFTVARRVQDEPPLARVEVLIAPDPAEIGLWYRLAPVSFLGGSFGTRGMRRNPLEAAALGSAIMHGPEAGSHRVAVARLDGAGAAAPVPEPEMLGGVLDELLAPDRAAQLARAAWAIASEGAEATEMVMDHVHALLDGEG